MAGPQASLAGIADTVLVAASFDVLRSMVLEVESARAQVDRVHENGGLAHDKDVALSAVPINAPGNQHMVDVGDGEPRQGRVAGAVGRDLRQVEGADLMLVGSPEDHPVVLGGIAGPPIADLRESIRSAGV